MAYVIVTYDIKEERVNKVRKVLKKYLMWVQNSVFEGEITEGKLEKCRQELLRVIKPEEDSVYFYRLENRLNYIKIVLGKEKELTGNII
ncbi:MAG: CRISPR-associated endonuclease Cas2 [Candidatus Desulfofervidaceae bacterium]|nr:CRISPR-associated endonuclease Cas2 [Candidatus Desulfofervidaceae bacterium]